MTKETANYAPRFSKQKRASGNEGIYLNEDTDYDASLIFALLIDASPPELQPKTPISWTTDSTTSLRQERLVESIGRNQIGLSAADNEQLLILSLEQTDANWKVDIHNPEFHLTRKGTIKGVDDHDHEGENVQEYEGGKHKWDVPHLDDRMTTEDP